MKFYICEKDSAMLGLRPSIQLGLVQINCSITTKDTRKIENIEDLANEYPDGFQGISNFPGKQKNIHLRKHNVSRPTPKKIPSPFERWTKKELYKMENVGVIEKVNGPTDWVNAIAWSKKKNGEIRIYLDPKPLNKVIKRIYYKILDPGRNFPQTS